MRFTNSPYEDFMKEKSYFKGAPPNLPPKGSRCDGCPYWHGIGCVFCYREQLTPNPLHIYSHGCKNRPVYHNHPRTHSVFHEYPSLSE